MTFISPGEEADHRHLTSSHLFQSHRKWAACPSGFRDHISCHLQRGWHWERAGELWVIKGLSLASLNSLAPCWKKAFAELMALGRGVTERRGSGGRRADVKQIECVCAAAFARLVQTRSF